MNKEFEVFDAIIIGSGQGGTPLAIELAKSGKKVALVERWHVGGSCVNIACTPTKTMVASAKVAHIVNKAKDYGINSKLESIDFSRIVQRKKEVVESFREGLQKQLLSTRGLTLIEGEARFIGKKLLKVSMNTGGQLPVQADLIIINSGASPSRPPIDGLETSTYFNSTSIMESDELPRHLLIIGGGYIGLEFGQMFKRLGSKVTIIQLDKQLLPNEDEDIAEEVAKILREEGIEILCNTRTIKVEAPGEKRIVLTVVKDEKEQTVEGSHLLVATGRVPNSANLNLESTGIKTDKHGFIPVNEYLETEVPGIYAIGDVNGEPQFTHISYDDYRILSKNILQNGNDSTSGRQLPYTVFIDPQLGRIGLTEKAAKEGGYDYKVFKMPMSWVARAIETGETEGIMKAIVNSKNNQILGAAILGLEGGEIMAILQITMLAGLPYTVLRDGIFSHPSISEALNILFDTPQG